MDADAEAGKSSEAAARDEGAVDAAGRAMPIFPEPAPPDRSGPAWVVAMCNQKGGVGKTT
ncbi:MAG: ParA family protein, partial [Trebonia sp.]